MVIGQKSEERWGLGTLASKFANRRGWIKICLRLPFVVFAPPLLFPSALSLDLSRGNVGLGNDVHGKGLPVISAGLNWYTKQDTSSRLRDSIAPNPLPIKNRSPLLSAPLQVCENL